jgi:ABC-2 type transport system permease protein
MRAQSFLVTATVLMAVIFIAGNLVVQKLLTGARLDFTENALYTLSRGTASTLKSVAEPVEITFVYSRSIGQEYPAIRAYAARARELLGAYADQSGGRVRVREIDPKPFSPAEDEALAAGITALDTDGNDPLYFGIVGRNTIDDERVIPFLAPERETTLEYDLTRMVARLDNPEPPRIGLISSLPGLSSPTQEGGYALLADIAKSFEIVPVAEAFQFIPEDVDVLLVAHPSGLSKRQMWLIDQFVLRKGRALFLVDPAAKSAVGESPFGVGAVAARSDLGLLGAAWGVTLSDAAVADAANALEISVDLGNGRRENLAHPLFIGVPASNMNERDLVTADLTRTVNFGAPGALNIGALPRGAQLSTLITTGPSASFIDAQRAMTDLKPADVLKLYKTEAAPLILAARLSGRFDTAFPDGAPPADASADAPGDPALSEQLMAEAANAPAHISASETDAELIFIADVDVLSNDFYIFPDREVVVADNAALVLNALDALSGGGELSRLRSRAASQRPMTRIDAMRADAEARYFRQQAELEQRLATAQTRLEELQAIGATDGFYSGDLEAVLSEDERAELSSLRDDTAILRGRLRDIERDYRRDIDRVAAILKALNIWGGPVLVTLAGLFVWRRQARRGGGRA